MTEKKIEDNPNGEEKETLIGKEENEAANGKCSSFYERTERKKKKNKQNIHVHCFLI